MLEPQFPAEVGPVSLNSGDLPTPAPIREGLLTCLSPPRPRVVSAEDWGGSGLEVPIVATEYALVPPLDDM